MSSEASVVTRQAESDDQLIELWLHGRPAHTARAYLADVERFLTSVGKLLRQVTLGDLQAFAESLEELAPASRYRIVSAVKSLLAFGHRIGYLPFDVGRMLRLPAMRNRLAERIFTETEMACMLRAETDKRNRTLLVFLYASGVRVSELCGLQWRDLRPNGTSGQVTVWGKGGQTRAVVLPRAVWDALQGLREEGTKPEDPVFVSRKGGALTVSAVFRVVRAAGSRAGIPGQISPHWFRHAHASHALDRGAPLHLVQSTLGHASISTTGRYLHARPNESSSGYLALPSPANLVDDTRERVGLLDSVEITSKSQVHR